MRRKRLTDMNSNSIKTPGKQIDYLSFASVVSALAVVFLHANGCFWTFSATAKYWKVANVIECVFYFAVPVFFMISGATLLDFYKRYGLKEYFRKRVQKTVIPYLVWSLLGIAIRLFYWKSIKPDDVTPQFIVNALLSGKATDVYWFFIPLFCIYLSIPLFAAVAEDKRVVVFQYLAIAGFILNCLIPFLLSLFHVSVSYEFSVSAVAGYLLFVILGYLLTHCALSPGARYLLYALSVAAFLVHLIGTYQASMEAGALVKTYKGYLNVPSIVYSVGIFVFFRYAGERLMQVSLISKLVNFLKDYTFSLYLLHIFILRTILKVFPVTSKSMSYRLGAPFATFAVTVLVTWLIRKIPVLRKTLP